MAGMWHSFWASLPYSSKVGPNIKMPMPPIGLQAPARAISFDNMAASAFDSPPPP
jgi:hypothetical protein